MQVSESVQSGVYQIVNSVTGQVYVGSSKDVAIREAEHFACLKSGRHINIWLQRSYLKHGRGAFVFEAIEYCNPLQLFERERHHIEQLRSEGVHLYNIGSVGGGDNISRHPNRAEIIKRMSIASTGRPGVVQPGEKNPNWRGGKPRCVDCSSVLDRQNQTGFCTHCRPRNGEKNSFHGKTHTEETRKKLAEKRMGSKPANSRPVRCNGIVYPSATEAGRQIGVCTATVLFRIGSKYFDYEYV